MYRYLIKPILFLFPPEQAHDLVFSWLRFFFAIPGIKAIFRSAFSMRDPRLAKDLWGLHFPNPVGLAAGFDKDGKLIHELEAFGFGFIEVGTVTPAAQPGNPKPRMFRLPEDHALINRMGFNNDGVEALASRLKNRKPGILVGGNIGKNKITPKEKAVNDYVLCFKVLFPYVDYFVVNVSSPNTPGLRELQEKGPLLEILNELMLINKEMSGSGTKPLLLKIAPDLSHDQLDDILSIVKQTGIHGIVATNTTLSREGLKSSDLLTKEAGGLSGKPLANRSTEVIAYLYKKSGGSFPIIASGGIHTATDAEEKLKAGASLVQVYTGFIYEGPAIAKKICNGLLKISHV